MTCKIGLRALPSILSCAAPHGELADNLRSGKSAHWMEIDDARAEYLQVRGTHSFYIFKPNINMSRDIIVG